MSVAHGLCLRDISGGFGRDGRFAWDGSMWIGVRITAVVDQRGWDELWDLH